MGRPHGIMRRDSSLCGISKSDKINRPHLWFFPGITSRTDTFCGRNDVPPPHPPLEKRLVITVNKPHVSSSRVDELEAHPAEHAEGTGKTFQQTDIDERVMSLLAAS